jgi:hypothetical protein
MKAMATTTKNCFLNTILKYNEEKGIFNKTSLAKKKILVHARAFMHAHTHSHTHTHTHTPGTILVSGSYIWNTKETESTNKYIPVCYAISNSS